MFHLVCYLRAGARVFETYWTNGRGVEAMDYSYALMDLTVYGRQEAWEDSPANWLRGDHYNYRRNGRPIAQWARLQAGHSDHLGTTGPSPESTRRLQQFRRADSHLSAAHS